VWEDYKVVGSWPGYITAYCLIAMGIYLLSNKQDFSQYSEEAKDLVPELSLGRFFHAIEEDLSRAKLERHLSSHQLTILNQSRKQGLNRGNSDPEIGSGSTRSTSTWPMDTFLDSFEDRFRNVPKAISQERTPAADLLGPSHSSTIKTLELCFGTEISDLADESAVEEDDLSHCEEGVVVSC
jgi:hypothetical protein